MSVKVKEIVRGGKRLALLLGVFAMNVCPAETVSGEPDTYLDYIVADGSQYINTEVNAETGLKVRADFAWGGSSANNNDWGLVGAKSSGSGNNARRMLMIHMYDHKPYVGYGLGARGNPGNATNFTRSVRCEVVADFSDASALEIYQNGAKTLTAANQATYEAQGNVDLGIPLYAFAYNEAGTANGKCTATLYGLRILRKNASGGFDLVRNYLPCLKDGRAALYDTVNNEVRFSDSGTDFAAGPVLPRPVEMVEWVQSDGKDPQYHWLDTWVYAKSGLRSEVDFTYKDDPQADRCILGALMTNVRFYMAYFYKGASCYGYSSLYSKGGSNVVEVPAENGKNYFVESDLSVGNQSVKVNGTEIHKDGVAHDDTYFATGNTLTLFALHKDAVSHTSYSSVRLFSAKIWDGDELLRDFAPCVDSNGKAGLYDSVSERVFHLGEDRVREFDLTNNVGAVTNWLAETAGALPDSKIGYIESDGTNDYFNLEVTAKDGVEMEAVMEWVTVPNDGAFVGARTDKKTGEKMRFFPYHYWKNGNNGHTIGYNSNLPEGGSLATAGTKYRIKSHLDAGDQWYTVEEDQNGTWSAPVRVSRAYAGPVDTGLPLYLFMVNYDGVPRFPGQVRLYRLKFREKQQNGEYALTRDFVPCKKDGKAMLYDNVSKTFFRNRGRYLAIGGGYERPFLSGTCVIIR